MGFWSSHSEAIKCEDASRLRDAALRYDALVEGYKKAYESAVARGSPYADIAQRRITELYKVIGSIRGHLDDVREHNRDIRRNIAESRLRAANS
nr:hypothetical protein TetV2_00251 [Oceanusvirus sp.]